MTKQPDSQVSEGQADVLWRAGWYRFAHRVDSPNFGPRPAGTAIDLIVIHSISLPPGQYGGDEVQRLFTNRLDWQSHPYYLQIKGMQVSSHFYIRRNGDLLQFVSVEQRAWHAGASNYRGRANCNDDSIGIEMEGVEGGEFEDAQYESLGDLCVAIAQTFPIQHVAGHEHVARGRKFDPGNGFDWLRLQRQLAWKPQCFPEVIDSKGVD
jgi:N-acetyl-anhydromuramoyl-L-alanine amidase